MTAPAPTPTKYVAARMLGRCANGNEADGGHLYHAIREDRLSWAAVCGATPGRRSAGWSDYPDSLRPIENVTCARCKRAMEMFGVLRRRAPRTEGSDTGGAP
jgi:hypothetical protein